MSSDPGIEKIEKKGDGRAGNGGARSGAGRKVRGPGKVKYDLKLAAQDYSETGLNMCVACLEDEDASWELKLRAIQMIWDRGHGRPVQAIEGTGEGGVFTMKIVA